jgi:hypothetical protein
LEFCGLQATECTSYAELLDVLRRRKDELNISFETLDATAGLQSNYASKILGPHPSRRLGEISLGCILGTLGLKLIVAPDPKALAKVRDRLVPRHPGATNHAGASTEPAGESAAALAT